MRPSKIVLFACVIPVAALSVMLTDGEKSDLVEYLKSLPSEEEASS